MSNLEFLYKGIPKETTEAWRKEAAEKWGKDAMQTSEEHLNNLSRASIEELKKELELVGQLLFDLRLDDPTEPLVQSLIARHYAVIRGFWGTVGSTDLQADAYAGLGELYVADGRYLRQNGQPQPEFAEFMRQAMKHFVERSLQ